MKKIFNIFLLIAMVGVAALTSCSKEDPFGGEEAKDGYGSVSFRKMYVEVRNDEKIIKNIPGRTRASVDVAAFVVTVKSADGTVAYEGTYAAMPEVLTLPVGEYTVTVNSPKLEDAAWEAPYYEGSQTFSVAKDDVVEVDPVVCKLANVMVTVRFEDKLLAAMGDDCKVTVVACQNGRLEYTASETRDGFFRFVSGEGTPTMIATFSGTVDENYEENFRTYTEVAPGNHYIITYRLHSASQDVPDPTGQLTPGVTVDATVTRVDMTIDVNVDDDILADDWRPTQGGEDPVTPVDPSGNPAPAITATDGISWTSANIVNASSVVEITVHSEAGITAFTVDIDSNTLTPSELEGVGMNSHIDLVNPGSMADSLVRLGFPINVGGQKDPDVMKLSQFLGLLDMLGPGIHKFHFTVSDANGTTKKTLTLQTLGN